MDLLCNVHRQKNYRQHRIGNSGADSCKLNICNSIGHLCKCWADVFQMPHHRQYVNVVRNPKTKFRSPSSDRTFNAKSLMGNRTLQHICKAHKTHRTEANLAKELQLPTHGKQSYNLTADHYLLHLQR